MYLFCTPNLPISVANHALKTVGETCILIRLDIFNHPQVRVLDGIAKILELLLSFRCNIKSFSASSLKDETHILLVLLVHACNLQFFFAWNYYGIVGYAWKSERFYKIACFHEISEKHFESF